MSLYLTVKWLHILSSVLLVGTGFGSAYYLFFANRSRDVAAIAVVGRLHQTKRPFRRPGFRANAGGIPPNTNP